MECRIQASWLHYLVTVRVASDLVPILPQFLGERVQALIQQADPPDAEGWITLTFPFETFEGARTTMLGFGTNVEWMVNWAARIVGFYAGNSTALMLFPGVLITLGRIEKLHYSIIPVAHR